MSFNPEKIKQGIEVEGYLRTREQVQRQAKEIKERRLYDSHYDNDTFTSEMLTLIGANRLFKTPHYDTGHCTEIDLLPFDNLGDFIEDFRTILSSVYEYSNEKDYLYMLTANNPVTGYAGAHQHLSIPHKIDGANKDIRDKLYVFQPFISLLGQNSSFEYAYIDAKRYDSYSGRYIDSSIPYRVLSELKDSRITQDFGDDAGGFSFKDRCRYYDYDEEEDDTCDDNGMLSPDYELGTMEVRYPSSASLFQVMGVATFLKACLFQKPNELQSREYDDTLSRMCNLVSTYGSLTPVNVKVPGYKSTVLLDIGTIFNMLLKTNAFSEGLERATDELDTRDASKVMRFFDIFSKGMSMTDFYNTALKDISSIDDQCNVIHKLGENEFLKGEMIVDKINPVDFKVNMNTRIKFPVLDSRIFDITEQVKNLKHKQFLLDSFSL